MPTVLVTGATGFIGRQVLHALQGCGWDIHAASADPPLPAVPVTGWHRVDLLVPGEATKLIQAARPSHLLHLAWYAEPGRYWTARENVGWVRASLDLVQAFIDAGGRRIVGAGSCAEYDWNAGHCVENQTPTAPETLYGASKLAAGLMTQAMAAQAGVGAAWARLFFLFGPFEHPDRLVASVVRALLAGRVAESTDGVQIRDFLYVKDVAAALVAILKSEVTGPVNVASGRPIPVRDVVLKIGQMMGRPDLIRLGARPADKVLRLTASTDRLSQLVGWTARYTLDRALEETIGWWRQQRSGARA